MSKIANFSLPITPSPKKRVTDRKVKHFLQTAKLFEKKSSPISKDRELQKNRKLLYKTLREATLVRIASAKVEIIFILAIPKTLFFNKQKQIKYLTRFISTRKIFREKQKNKPIYTSWCSLRGIHE